MSEKYFSLKLLFFFQILNAILCNEIDIDVGLSSDNERAIPTESESSTQEMAILLPDKKSAPQVNGFLPSLTKVNSSSKLFADKQFNERQVRNKVISHADVDAIYNCTADSVLSLLALHSEFDNYFTCSQVVDITHEYKLNATLRRLSRKTGQPLTTTIATYDSAVKMIFYKGNQMYYSTGTVENGYCRGEKVTILNVNLVRKGSCTLRSGVQQIVSDYAQLSVSGKCESTCFGDVNISINPGLRN